MDKVYDVIIAGAGPIGLFLACELALAKASVLILERDIEAESPWKVSPLGRRGLNTVSVEALYRRGLLDKFVDIKERPTTVKKASGFQFAGHFAGIMLDASKLDMDRWKYVLPGPALFPAPTTINRIETVLTERAESLGVTILKGHGVTKIADQDEDSVLVEVGENKSFRGRWLVGCDGGRSEVRRAVGFDFVGTDAKFLGYIVKCEFDHPEKVKPGFHVTKNGMYIIAPDSLYLVDFESVSFDRSQEITQKHIQEVFNRISGITDVNITTMHLTSSFTDRSKQTTSYRKGRIILAGDAAHIHSPLGAQGLNLGLGDAINLGWKLAATIRQESQSDRSSANLTLLDTYEGERHPIGAWVLEWSRAQVSTLQPDMYGAATQALIRDLINTTDGNNLFIDRVWGLSQRYKLSNSDSRAHPLVGCSAPDFEFSNGSRLGPMLAEGRGLLVDFENDTALKKLVAGRKYENRVDYICMDALDKRGLHALLIRPDGIVAWVAEADNTDTDIGSAEAALAQWFEY